MNRRDPIPVEEIQFLVLEGHVTGTCLNLIFEAQHTLPTTCPSTFQLRSCLLTMDDLPHDMPL